MMVRRGPRHRQHVRALHPIRPASRRRLIAGIAIGACAWLIALALLARVVHTGVIAQGLAVTVIAFLVALCVLTVLRQGRIRQERRYVDRR